MGFMENTRSHHDIRGWLSRWTIYMWSSSLNRPWRDSIDQIWAPKVLIIDVRPAGWIVTDFIDNFLDSVDLGSTKLLRSYWLTDSLLHIDSFECFSLYSMQVIRWDQLFIYRNQNVSFLYYYMCTII